MKKIVMIFILMLMIAGCAFPIPGRHNDIPEVNTGDFIVNLRQFKGVTDESKMYVDISSDVTDDEFYFTITYVSDGEVHTSDIISKADSKKNVKFENSATEDDVEIENGSFQISVEDLGLDIDDGTDMYLTVTKVNTDEVVQSNTIVFEK